MSRALSEGDQLEGRDGVPVWRQADKRDELKPRLESRLKTVVVGLG